MSEELKLADMKSRMRIFTELNSAWIDSLGSSALPHLLRTDLPALFAEIERLRAALGRRGAQEELEQQILKLKTYAMNWHGTEFGGLIERDKVLAALRGVGVEAGAHGGTPQEKEQDRR